jgi:hypothetical protein
MLMTLQELESQALQLPIGDRLQLMQTLVESLQKETHQSLRKGNLSRLRGIAKNLKVSGEEDTLEDYATYLTEKYQ